MLSKRREKNQYEKEHFVKYRVHGMNDKEFLEFNKKSLPLNFLVVCALSLFANLKVNAICYISAFGLISAALSVVYQKHVYMIAYVAKAIILALVSSYYAGFDRTFVEGIFSCFFLLTIESAVLVLFKEKILVYLGGAA